MAKDLSKIAKQKKIIYFLISFVDLFGVLRSKLVKKKGANKLAPKFFYFILPLRFDVFMSIWPR